MKKFAVALYDEGQGLTLRLIEAESAVEACKVRLAQVVANWLHDKKYEEERDNELEEISNLESLEEAVEWTGQREAVIEAIEVT